MAERYSLTVNTVNGITRTQTECAAFLVYLIKFSNGSTYVVESQDLVTSWYSIYNTSWNNTPNSVTDKVRAAVVKFRDPEFFVVALAKSKDESQARKSAAIQYYAPDLNTSSGVSLSQPSFFDSLDKVVNTFELASRSTNHNNIKFEDKDRDLLIGEIVINRAKKRFLVVEGAHKGKFVSCSNSERDKFPVGAKVKIKAAMMSNGTLKAANKAKLLPA
ncbi:hypothetical protein [Shewanella sp. 125m-1]